jgi:hypothetical protein
MVTAAGWGRGRDCGAGVLLAGDGDGAWDAESGGVTTAPGGGVTDVVGLEALRGPGDDAASVFGADGEGADDGRSDGADEPVRAGIGASGTVSGARRSCTRSTSRGALASGTPSGARAEWTTRWTGSGRLVEYAAATPAPATANTTASADPVPSRRTAVRRGPGPCAAAERNIAR